MECDTAFRTTFRLVRNMTRAGQPFERIESFIERQPGLDIEEKAVLWLCAWAGGEPSEVVRLLDADVEVVGILVPVG